MTVSNTKSFNEHISTGVETTWPFTFDVTDPSQVKVYVIDLNNISSDVTASATIDISSKTVTYGPIDKDYILRIERETPATQEVDLNTQGPLLPQVLEDALDKLTFISQEARNLANEMRDVVAKDIKYVGDWTTGVTYKENQAVTRYGNLYICKTGHISDSTNGPVDGQSNAYWVIAVKKGEAFKWKGSWTFGSYYTPNDAVEHNGSSYVCIVAHTADSTNEPEVGSNWSSYWDLFAQSGDVIGPSYSTDNNVAVFDGTTGRIIKDSGFSPAKYVTPEQFGAVGDGVADDTSALQASLDHVIANNYVLYLSGVYRTTSTLSVPSGSMKFSIIGANKKASIRPDFTAGNVLELGSSGSTDPVKWIEIKNLTIDPHQTMTSGFGIYIRRGYRVVIDNCDIQPQDAVRLYGGVWFDGFDKCRVQSSFLAGINTAIKCNGDPGDAWGAGLFIDGCKITNIKTTNPSLVGAKGIHVAGNAGGITIETCDIIHCYDGVYIDKAQTLERNREVFISPMTAIDSCDRYGVYIDSDSMADFKMVGTWVASNNGTASTTGLASGDYQIYISSSPSLACRAIVNDLRIYNGYRGGIYLGENNKIIMNGCIIFNNNREGLSAQHTIYADCGGEISSCYLFNNNSLGGFGINIGANATDLFITSNKIKGYGTSISYNGVDYRNYDLIKNKNVIVSNTTGDAYVHDTLYGCAKAYASTQTTVPTNTVTVVSLDAKQFGAGFDLAGGELYIPVSGIYEIIAGLKFDTTVDASRVSIVVERNDGASYTQIINQNHNTSGTKIENFYATNVVELQEGVSLRLKAYHEFGSDVLTSAGSQACFIQIKRVA